MGAAGPGHGGGGSTSPWNTDPWGQLFNMIRQQSKTAVNPFAPIGGDPLRNAINATLRSVGPGLSYENAFKWDNATKSPSTPAAAMPMLNAAAPQPRAVSPAPSMSGPVTPRMSEGALSSMADQAQYALNQGYLPRMMSPETINALGNKLDPSTLNKLYTFQNGMYYLNPDQTQYAEPGTSPNSVGGSPTGDQGAALAPGERGRTSWGGYLIGGEPTTKDQGNTPAGTAQYAQISNNIRGNKWRVVVEKDANGNWVKKTIADYGHTRRQSHQLRGRRKARLAAQAAANQNTEGGIGLVNFNTSTG